MIYFSDLKQMFWIRGADGEPVWFDTEREARAVLAEMDDA